MKLHFFISRAGEDNAWGKWISKVLEKEGHTTVIQDFDFRPGHNILHQMKLAEEKADHFIAVLSPHYLTKPFTLKELYSGLADDPVGEKRLVIPVRVADCKVPRLIQDLSYIDFVGKDKKQCRRALLEGILPKRTTQQAEFPGQTPAPIECRTSVQRLPVANPNLFGRATQLKWLEKAWADRRTNVAQIVAPGGTGKTALMTRWYRRHLENATIFGWSFYSQGTGEKTEASSYEFFTEALRWFGINAGTTDSIYFKVDQLAARLRRERILLILDGIEPLQDASGNLRDMGLKRLLQELAARNAGLVLCTTRVGLRDLQLEDPIVRSLDLENLDPSNGARYLAHLGVRADDESELRAASESYGNHALALTLLGTYLATFCGGDIRRRTDIRELQVAETAPGQHARKVMAGYERLYAGQPELEILRALGYFDRPAEPDALALVLPKMSGLAYRASLQRLLEARLILSADPARSLDCHPLIREYFAKEATHEGHGRLYEHYVKQVQERPKDDPFRFIAPEFRTIEAMAPLLHAIYHGCKADRHQDALAIYRRIKGDLAYYFGAFGIDLSLLSGFFETPWTVPLRSLSETEGPRLLHCAGFSLRASGRLAEAIEPMRRAAEGLVRAEDWDAAALVHAQLSDIQLILGNVSEAIGTGRKAVEFADRSRTVIRCVASRAFLAHALHQVGEIDSALRLFVEAERIQATHVHGEPFLFSFSGYLYDELLLDMGQVDKVLSRHNGFTGPAGRPLDAGLERLAIGRTFPPGSDDAMQFLNKAVGYLRRAGSIHVLPRALLCRGTPRDLEEAYRIAQRSGMRLYLADYHLACARLLEDKAHLDEAERLIHETGYHLRDGSLNKLKAELNLNVPARKRATSRRTSSA